MKTIYQKRFHCHELSYAPNNIASKKKKKPQIKLTKYEINTINKDTENFNKTTMLFYPAQHSSLTPSLCPSLFFYHITKTGMLFPKVFPSLSGVSNQVYPF